MLFEGSTRAGVLLRAAAAERQPCNCMGRNLAPRIEKKPPRKGGFCNLFARLALHQRRLTPDVYCEEQEQPDNVDEVPVPGSRLKPDVFLRREVTLERPD